MKKNHYFLSIFLPSWKFFEDIGSFPILYYRLKEGNCESPIWVLYEFKTQRKILNLFCNSQTNYNLYCRTILEKLLEEIKGIDLIRSQEIENSQSFQFIKNLISRQAFSRPYQFKIDILDSRTMKVTTKDILVSKIYHD